MAITYPGTLDVFTNPVGTNTLNAPDHAGQHDDANDAAIALERKVGVGSGTPTANLALIGSGNGTSGWTGTWNSATLGTPAITGGTATSTVLNTNTIGTPAITGGTATNTVLNTNTIGTPAITGGTASAITLGTPIVTQINSSGTTVPTTFGESIAPTTITLSDSAGGTITPNAAAGQIHYLSLGTTAGNRTIGTPTNPTAGQSWTLAVKASGSANGTLLWASIFKFSQDVGTPAVGTGTTWNYYGWRYNSVGTTWDFVGHSLNVI